MAQAEGAPEFQAPLLPRWKTAVSTVCAVLLGLLFLASGVWKATDPLAAAVRMTQALIPQLLSLPTALGFGIAETFAAVLLLVPRYRRWGAWLTGLMLVAFMVYIGINYGRLRGEDCNCFPWVERAVGPAFFIGDGIMLLLAAGAGWWARPARDVRGAAVVLGAVCVFAALSFGVAEVRSSLVSVPESIDVGGKPFNLHEGRVFLYFFNPECLHCAAGARELGKLDWGQTKVIGVTTQLPEFGQDFLDTTNLRALLSSDVETLKKSFHFVDVPFGVAIQNGRHVASFTHFEDGSAVASLKKLGFAR
jgi:uncharacterized membrane protein YphA (DoxX/SURF4 family)